MIFKKITSAKCKSKKNIVYKTFTALNKFYIICKTSAITYAEILQNRLFKNCFKSTENILLKTVLNSHFCQSYERNYRLQKVF